MKQKLTTSLQQKWVSKLLGYDYVIIYKKGKENLAADALSRIYEGEDELNVVTMIKPLWKEDLQESYKDDEIALEMFTVISIQRGSVDDFKVEQDELKWKGKYYVGNSNKLRTTICENIHCNSDGGHSGITASIKRA